MVAQALDPEQVSGLLDFMLAGSSIVRLGGDIAYQ
jgi:hypothetical protein